MLQDTMLELLHELRQAPDQTPFDKGYRQGMARALDVIKIQSEVFGIGESVGLRSFDYGDWVG